MPCQISDEEARFIEMTSNRKKFGVLATDADILATVACGACGELERLKLPMPSPLVRLWWAEHKRRDIERKRDATAVAKQKEVDERATLKKLLEKYPDER